MRHSLSRRLCALLFAAAAFATAGTQAAHAGGHDGNGDHGTHAGHGKPGGHTLDVTHINNGNSYSFQGIGSITQQQPPQPPAEPCTTGSQDSSIVYTALPVDVLQCSQVPSLGYEATGTREFGDEVGPTPVGRTLSELRVLFQSYACSVSGHWNTGDCVTTTGATFTHPVTANIYAVNTSSGTPAPGALLATVTQTQTIPYRPSADPTNCTGADAGKFLNTNTGRCANSIGRLLTFAFPSGVTLPSQVIWTVAFNTTHYGNPPIGEAAACFSSNPGCPYDSLNVGAFSFTGAPYRGTDIDPNGAFLNSVVASSYCDGGAGGTGTLRLDTPCWAGYRPLGEIRAT
ncbi:hypothetical protein [Streptomyces sp. NPDC047000]|uniref:hypothetical protein n=1 Tax=Streptomyces sp. NPDC047000 TaxID=3155474 RepID=UPI0033F10EFD